MRITNPIGKRGEDTAAEFLKNKGYKIIERNFRKGYGEIDIICLDPSKHILVFVEVKTRTSNQYGAPLESITSWKLRLLVKAAQFYSMTHKKLPEELRIDAIGVILKGDFTSESIEYVENITDF